MREVRWHRIGEFGIANDAGELFAMQVTEVIKKSGIHRVVEREQIVATFEELNISTTSLADENTRLRLWMAISNHGFTMRRYPISDERKKYSNKQDAVFRCASSQCENG